MLGVIVALGLYLIGFKILLIPVVVLALAFWLPFPTVFKSLTSRLLVSVLVFYSIFQLAAVTQYFIAYDTGYVFSATITSLIALAVVAVGRPKILRPVIVRDDAWAGAVGLLFAIPIAIFCFGPNGVYRTASIGSLQPIDGMNHYGSIAQVDFDQKITYAKGNSYPVGYHLTTAFTQNSFSISQATASWNANARIYVIQYLATAMLLGVMLYYLLCSLMDKLHSGNQKPYSSGALAAGALGLPLTLFYMLPFLSNGFLNYYYICAAAACGLIYLLSYEPRAADAKKPIGVASQRYLVMYLLLIFGVSMSWPLLTPVFLLIAGLYFLQNNIRQIIILRNLVSPGILLVVSGFLIQFIPAYFQVINSVAGTSDSINATGSLYGVHVTVLLIGLGVTLYVLHDKAQKQAMEFAKNVLVPLYLFLALLAAYQYFTVGEVRYYFIKSSLLVELMILALLAAVIVGRYAHTAGRQIQSWYVVFVPFLILFLAIGVNTNPLGDSRALFRSYSSQEKPAYFDEDIAAYIKLGQAGKIGDFNSTLLHYDADKGKIYAHMQISYWANTMGFGAQPLESQARGCNLELYSNLNFGTFTDTEQREAVNIIKDCAQIAREAGRQYYIITDKASEDKITELFGPPVKIVSR